MVTLYNNGVFEITQFEWKERKVANVHYVAIL